MYFTIIYLFLSTVFDNLSTNFLQSVISVSLTYITLKAKKTQRKSGKNLTQLSLRLWCLTLFHYTLYSFYEICRPYQVSHNSIYILNTPFLLWLIKYPCVYFFITITRSQRSHLRLIPLITTSMSLLLSSFIK